MTNFLKHGLSSFPIINKVTIDKLYPLVTPYSSSKQAFSIEKLFMKDGKDNETGDHLIMMYVEKTRNTGANWMKDAWKISLKYTHYFDSFGYLKANIIFKLHLLTPLFLWSWHIANLRVCFFILVPVVLGALRKRLLVFKYTWHHSFHDHDASRI